MTLQQAEFTYPADWFHQKQERKKNTEKELSHWHFQSKSQLY